jgi:hypothetical protein
MAKKRLSAAAEARIEQPRRMIHRLIAERDGIPVDQVEEYYRPRIEQIVREAREHLEAKYGD